MATRLTSAAALADRICTLHRNYFSGNADLQELADWDIIKAVGRTATWIGCKDADGIWRVAPAKLAGYDLPLSSYPAERRTMDEVGLTIRLAHDCGRVLPAGHEAYQEVSAVVARLGAHLRVEYEVVELDPAHVQVQPPPKPGAPGVVQPEDAIVEAIGKLVPLLGEAGRGRVRTLVTR